MAVQLSLAPYPGNFTEIRPFGAFLSVPSRESAGFVIADNYFSGNRGRGVHAGANRGVIARNKILDMCYAGVSMNPDWVYTDANFASNILVRAPEEPRFKSGACSARWPRLSSWGGCWGSAPWRQRAAGQAQSWCAPC